jgi:tetratricopeptide (TPR) repeat protein
VRFLLVVITLLGVSGAARAQVADSSSTAIAKPVDPAMRARAEACLDSARTAASADRHHAAILWYRRAITFDPSLAAELNLELGHQYTWADKPDSAVTFYRTHLATHPNDIDAEIGLGRALAWSGHIDEAIATYQHALPHAGEHENEIRVGIARAESWKDDHDAARRDYEAILAGDPNNLDARIGRAQVTNWSGRHREASRMYEEILSGHPDNADAREGLAAAQYWLGRTDLARATLRDAKRTPSAIAFENDMERSIAPDASYSYEQNKDSDEIKRRTHTFDAGLWTDDLTRVGGEYGHGKYEQPGRPDVSRNWLAAVLRRRFNETWVANAAVGWQWNSFDRSALSAQSYWQNDFNLFTIDGYATFTPRDWMRWDFGLFHGSLTNPDAIFRGISLTELSAGLDWRLGTNLLSASSAGVSFYSDANTRTGLGERLVWQPLWRMPVHVSHRFTSTTGFGYFGFTKTDPDNGYYDPRQYLSLYEEVALDMTFSKRARGHISGRYGFDRENGDDWFDVGRFEISGSFVVHPRVSLTAGYYNSTSRLDSREGYAADGFYVNLDYIHHD